jgi:hypothetical protein
VIRDVLRKEDDMRAGNPDAIHDAKQQAVKKMAVRPVSRDEVCAHEEDGQPEDRLDIQRITNTVATPMANPKRDRPKINFQSM